MARVVDVTEHNREVIRRHYERFAAADWRAAGGDFAEEASNFGRPVGREGILRVLEDIYTTFPDWSMEIEDMAAEGDNVVVRCRVSGTHLGVGRLHVNGGSSSASSRPVSGSGSSTSTGTSSATAESLITTPFETIWG